jgi:DNA repair protein RecN (Recombination protein N)
MLHQLHISNLAVIADATVEFDSGLNCFTGQTGAGKSLVIGALEMLLGLRPAQDMLRKGAGEGRVSGVFAIRNKALREQIAAATDLPLDGEEELIMARRIHESGRTSASINGHPITSAMLKQVGEILVDVHGQHDAQFLLKPANQLQVIDEFGGSTDLRAEFAELYRERQQLSVQQSELNASRTLRKQQLELYEFQAGEIDDAQLVAGEHEELQARHKVMSNLERIKKEASIAYGGLYEDEGAIVARLKSVFSLLSALAEVDDGLAPISQQIKEATMNLDDAAYTLRRHIDKLDLDPGELTEVAERLNLVTRLVDKYAGHAGTLADVIAYREQIGGQIAELKTQDQDFSSVAGKISAIEKKLKEVGAALTKARKKAVEKLLPRVHEQLSDLGMKEAKFSVEFSALDNFSPRHQGAKTPRKEDAREMKLTVEDFSTSAGMETVEFMIAPNPGQPARPLRKIASGGELSRVMLALKSILAQADRVSVLVFDEIDANVGGRMGSVIGEKLRDLAKIHQVLCITHLPQIAAFADRHLTIRKSVKGSETTTTVQTMEGEARVRELAEMITGKDVSETSLAQAQELMGLGAKKKRK